MAIGIDGLQSGLHDGILVREVLVVEVHVLVIDYLHRGMDEILVFQARVKEVFHQTTQR